MEDGRRYHAGLEQPATADLAAFYWRAVLVVAAGVAVAHLTIATRYGWHRDEFYYVVAGRHPAWGYVDQPPLTPVMARAAAAVSEGLVGLRIVAIAIQGSTIVVGALVAREMGGARRAQVMAAGCIAGCAVFVGASLFLGTTPVDQFLWSVIVWCVVRAVRVGRVGAWAMAGVAAGVGLENKHTVAVLLIGLFVGLLARRRQALRGPGPWLAALLAAALWAPNLWWDATHHWVTFDMARVLADKQGGVVGSLGQLPLLLLIFPGPLIVFVLVRGLRVAWRDGADRPYCWLVVAAGVVVAVFTLAGGKPYYSAPMYVPFFALGSVASERAALGRRRPSRLEPVLVAGSAVAAAVLSLPYLPPSFASAVRPLSKEPMETYGWPAFAAQVAAVASKEAAAVAVYVSNYGEAGALATYGHVAGLSLPVVAGQNAYRDWGPPAGTPTEVIAVGEFDRDFLLRSWADVERVATVKLPHGLQNEETENDAAIYVCRGPTGSWQALWSTLSYLS